MRRENEEDEIRRGRREEEEERRKRGGREEDERGMRGGREEEERRKKRGGRGWQTQTDRHTESTDKFAHIHYSTYLQHKNAVNAMMTS